MKDAIAGLIKNGVIKTGILALLSVIDIYLAVSLETWTKSANRAVVAIFAVVGSAVCFLLNKSLAGRREKRLIVHAALWGVPMAAAYVLGCRLRRDGTALAGAAHLPELLAQILCLAFPAAACIAFLLRGFPRLHAMAYRRGGGKKKYREGRVWLFCSAVIFLCWTPVFLAYYPSVFAYDAEGQLYQVIAHDYSTHHPLLHTLFLGAFFRLGGQVLGSYSAGMAVHSVVQMALMACAFGYALAYLYRKGVSAYLRLVLLLFYAFFPTNSILALSTTKDVLFAALVLLYTLAVFRLLEERAGNGEEAFENAAPKDWTSYIVFSVLLLLFRNNAVYAWALSVPILYAGLGGGKISSNAKLRRGYAAASAAAFLLFLVCGMTLKAILGAQNGSPREMLSVPLQQMARTRVKAEDTLTPEMRLELEKYLSSEWVFAAYDPHLADPVKSRAVIHDDPAGLLKTWVKLGLQHPQIYIDAFLDNSVGYWFLEDRTHAQIYGVGTESGFGYLSTDNRTMPAGCEIVEHSYLPGLRAAMERIVSDNAYQKLPVIRVLFAPAFYWWLLCMYIAVAVYRRKYGMLLPAVFLAVYYLTLLLSPTVLIRYMYPYVVTVPVMCCLMSAQSEGGQGKIYNKS